MEADILKGHKNALQVTRYEKVDVFLLFFMVKWIWTCGSLKADAPGHYNEVTWVQILPLEMKQKSVFLKSYPDPVIKAVLNDTIKELPSIADIPDCSSTAAQVWFQCSEQSLLFWKDKVAKHRQTKLVFKRGEETITPAHLGRRTWSNRWATITPDIKGERSTDFRKFIPMFLHVAD